jgi:hypothetical protein
VNPNATQPDNRPVLPALLYPADAVPMKDFMTTRVTTKTVIFRRPFTVDKEDGELPPGIYTVDTEEELLDTVSFPAYRRVSTVMYCSTAGGNMSLVTIDPVALEAALARDAKAD